MQHNYTIAIADSHFLSRLGLRNLIQPDSRYKIVAEASKEASLLQILQEKRPDLVIIDYYQPDCFSADTIQKIKEIAPEVRILAISSDHDKNSIYKVLEQGVHSFLTKSCGEQEVSDAIAAAVKGEKFFCTKILDYLLERSFGRAAENCGPTPLSIREIEIVKLVSQGMVAKEIADKLNLSPHTVYTHRKKIMKKLNLGSSSELVHYALKNGIA